MSRKSYRRQTGLPHEVILTAALLMSVVMACLLLSLGRSQPTQPARAGRSNQAAARRRTPVPAAQGATLLGSAFLDLGQLARVNSIDEADNARWSLVRGTSTDGEVYSQVSGVDWQALRTFSQSGAYTLPAGNTWSFNETFGGGPGYKNASGVLAGGQCALATVFRAASIQAGLPNQAIPHQWPIPGFPVDETVTIWWGRDDLLIHNPTGRDLSLKWDLSPQGIKISILSFNVD
jgi:hypothetical protein